MGNIICAILDAKDGKEIIKISPKSTKTTKSTKSNEIVDEAERQEVNSVERQDVETIDFDPFDVSVINSTTASIKSALGKIKVDTNTEVIKQLKQNIDILYYRLCYHVIKALMLRASGIPNGSSIINELSAIKTYDDVTIDNVDEINEKDGGANYNKAISIFANGCKAAKIDAEPIITSVTSIFTKVTEQVNESITSMREIVKVNKNNWNSMYSVKYNPKILAIQAVIDQAATETTESFAEDADKSYEYKLVIEYDSNTGKLIKDEETYNEIETKDTPVIIYNLYVANQNSIVESLSKTIDRDQDQSFDEFKLVTHKNALKQHVPSFAEVQDTITAEELASLIESNKADDELIAKFNEEKSKSRADDERNKDITLDLIINYNDDPEYNIIKDDLLLNHELGDESETPKVHVNLKLNGTESNYDVDRDVNKTVDAIKTEEVAKILREQVPGFSSIQTPDNFDELMFIISQHYDQSHTVTELPKAEVARPKLMGVLDIDKYEAIKEDITAIINEAEQEYDKLAKANIDTSLTDVSKIIEAFAYIIEDFYDLNEDGEDLMKMDKELGEMYSSIQDKIEQNATNAAKVFEDELIVDIKNKMKIQLSFIGKSNAYINAIGEMNTNITNVKKALDDAKKNNQTTDRLIEEFERQVKNWNEFYEEVATLGISEEEYNRVNALLDNNESSFTTLRDEMNKLEETDKYIRNQFNKAVELYSNLVQLLSAVNDKMSAFYNVIINQQKNYLQLWESETNDKKTNMEINFEEITKAIEDADVPAKANLKTQIEQLKVILVQLKDKYARAFGINNNSYWEQFELKKQAYNEFLEGSDTDDFYTKIKNAVDAFFDVKLVTIELDAINEDSNDLWYQGKLLQIEIERKAIIEEIKLKDQEQKEEYDDKFNELVTTVKNNLNLLISFRQNIDEGFKSVKLFIDSIELLFGENMIKLMNSSNKTISDKATKAFNSKLDLESEYDTALSKINIYKLTCDQHINSLKAVINSSNNPNIYERMSIDNINVIIEGNNIENMQEKFYKLQDLQKQLLNSYDLLCSDVSDVYDDAAQIDKNFESLRNKLIEDYKTTLKELSKSITEYAKNVNEQVEDIKTAADILYCRYAELYNIVYTQIDKTAEKIEEIHTLTINGKQIATKCSEVTVKINGVEAKTSLEQLYSACDALWQDLKDYASQEITDEHTSILNEILVDIKNVQDASVQADEYVVSYREKVANLINAQIDILDREMQSYQNIRTLDEATEAKNSIIQNYQTCLSIVSNETGKQFELKRSMCETAYDKVYNLISTKLVSFMAKLNAKTVFKKRNIIRYVNACKILAYLFGHYKIGLSIPDDSFEMNLTSGTDDENGMYPWKVWLQKEIRNCLLPVQYREIKNGVDYRLDVFNTLMLYAPVVPLIWPYGDSDIEKQIQTAWKETAKVTGAVDCITFMMEKKDLFLEYINTVLVKYICNAIVNTMDKTCYSALEAIIKRENMSTTIEEVNADDTIEDKYLSSDEDDITLEDMLKMETEIKPMYEQAKQLQKQMNEKYKVMYQNSSVKNITKTEIDTTYKDNKIIKDTWNTYNAAKKEYDEIHEQYDTIINKLSDDENLLRAAYKKKLDKQEKADAAGYFAYFMNKSYDCASPFADDPYDVVRTDNEIEQAGNKMFTELCHRVLSVNNNVVLDGPDTHHSYWKLLRTMSGKISANTNATYMPTFYPSNFPINNVRAEKVEAAIIILNRIFDKLGYVSYDIMDIPGKAAQPVAYKDYLDYSIKTNFIDGGRGLDYDDKSYYENRMRVGQVYVPGSLEINTGNLFIDSEETGFNLDNYRMSCSSKPYYMIGDDIAYFKFVNSTDLYSYMFDNDVSTSTNAQIDCINIKSITAGRPEESTCLKYFNYVDTIVTLFMQRKQSQKVSDLYYSTDYVLNNELVSMIYNHVLGNVLNWKLLFPVTNTNAVYEKKGWYPITKINTCLFDTVMQQIVNNSTKTVGFGQTIYSIFDFVNNPNKSSTGTTNVSITPSCKAEIKLDIIPLSKPAVYGNSNFVELMSTKGAATIDANIYSTPLSMVESADAIKDNNSVTLNINMIFDSRGNIAYYDEQVVKDKLSPVGCMRVHANVDDGKAITETQMSSDKDVTLTNTENINKARAKFFDDYYSSIGITSTNPVSTQKSRINDSISKHKSFVNEPPPTFGKTDFKELTSTTGAKYIDNISYVSPLIIANDVDKSKDNNTLTLNSNMILDSKGNVALYNEQVVKDKSPYGGKMEVNAYVDNGSGINTINIKDDKNTSITNYDNVNKARAKFFSNDYPSIGIKSTDSNSNQTSILNKSISNHKTFAAEAPKTYGNAEFEEIWAKKPASHINRIKSPLIMVTTVDDLKDKNDIELHINMMIDDKGYIAYYEEKVVKEKSPYKGKIMIYAHVDESDGKRVEDYSPSEIKSTSYTNTENLNRARANFFANNFPSIGIKSGDSGSAQRARISNSMLNHDDYAESLLVNDPPYAYGDVGLKPLDYAVGAEKIDGDKTKYSYSTVNNVDNLIDNNTITLNINMKMDSDRNIAYYSEQATKNKSSTGGKVIVNAYVDDGTKSVNEKINGITVTSSKGFYTNTEIVNKARAKFFADKYPSIGIKSDDSYGTQMSKIDKSKEKHIVFADSDWKEYGKPNLFLFTLSEGSSIIDNKVYPDPIIVETIDDSIDKRNMFLYININLDSKGNIALYEEHVNKSKSSGQGDIYIEAHTDHGGKAGKNILDILKRTYSKDNSTNTNALNKARAKFFNENTSPLKGVISTSDSISTQKKKINDSITKHKTFANEAPKTFGKANFSRLTSSDGKLTIDETNYSTPLSMVESVDKTKETNNLTLNINMRLDSKGNIAFYEEQVVRDKSTNQEEKVYVNAYVDNGSYIEWRVTEIDKSASITNTDNVKKARAKFFSEKYPSIGIKSDSKVDTQKDKINASIKAHKTVVTEATKSKATITMANTSAKEWGKGFYGVKATYDIIIKDNRLTSFKETASIDKSKNSNRWHCTYTINLTKNGTKSTNEYTYKSGDLFPTEKSLLKEVRNKVNNAYVKPVHNADYKAVSDKI